MSGAVSPQALWTSVGSGDAHAPAAPAVVSSVSSPAGFEDDPQAVLQTMRRYIHTFFGCKECGEHFEEMAKESMDSVKTPDQAILWLWKKHNMVNGRLAGEKPLGMGGSARAEGGPGPGTARTARLRWGLSLSFVASCHPLC